MPKREKIRKKVCRNCKAILEPDVKKCPYCGSTDFSEEYIGFVIIIDEEKSELAKKTNLKKGTWAIRVL